MKSVKRIVNTSFWDDELVLEKFTPKEKYFMLYLLTNPYSTQLGVYYLPLKKSQLDLGINGEEIEELINKFQDGYSLIKYSEKTSEVAINNYLRHSIVKGGKPVEDCLKKEEREVKDKDLMKHIYKHLLNHWGELNQTVRDFLAYLNELYGYDNENENENERIVPRIVNQEKEKPKKVDTSFKAVLGKDEWETV